MLARILTAILDHKIEVCISRVVKQGDEVSQDPDDYSLFRLGFQFGYASIDQLTSFSRHTCHHPMGLWTSGHTGRDGGYTWTEQMDFCSSRSTWLLPLLSARSVSSRDQQWVPTMGSPGVIIQLPGNGLLHCTTPITEGAVFCSSWTR